MRDSFECPACAAGDWESVSVDVYRRPPDATDSGVPANLALRRRVLFELWLPGSGDVRLTNVMCRNCGFMTYRPRPTGGDIDAKYRLLQREEPNIGARGDDTSMVQRDLERARRVFATVTGATSANTKPLAVLDFGGGDGKMLVPFREAGHNCSLVDYNASPLEGIEKAGDTLDDLPESTRFDAIICSHVLEHLADPAGHVARFKQHLNPGGVVYGEVPSGIWRGLGIADDPVTHVNFFTRYAFGHMFERAGLSLVTLRRRVGFYSRRIDVIVAVGRNDAAPGLPLVNDGVTEARARLQPTLAMDIARRIRLRRYPSVGDVVRRLTHRGPSKRQ